MKQGWLLENDMKEPKLKPRFSMWTLYHVMVPLTFLRSNQPYFIVMFLFLADQIFHRSYLDRHHFGFFILIISNSHHLFPILCYLRLCQLRRGNGLNELNSFTEWGYFKSCLKVVRWKRTLYCPNKAYRLSALVMFLNTCSVSVKRMSLLSSGKLYVDHGLLGWNSETESDYFRTNLQIVLTWLSCKCGHFKVIILLCFRII